MMRKAFDPSNGPLIDLGQPAAEREALSALFAGAIGHAKNPPSHRDVTIGAREAAQLLGFASYLLELVTARHVANLVLNDAEEPGSDHGV